MKPYLKFLALLQFLLLTAAANAAAPHIDVNRTRQKAKQSLAFCKQKGYNARYCILIDMSLHSGVKRFMVWDFRKNDTMITGLVSHGCASAPWSGVWTKDKPVFSNSDGSHCTALGKYQINGRAYSAWGIHVKYFLTGLESTNNNAYVRQIVFHSWEKVAEADVYPNGTPEGWGCPAISNNTLKIVDALIRKQKKRMLMWIYS
ncbi:murein L,D-transpeptidase catalytic domain-containing protein [Mucilaginibacter sp. OK283]|uniref:murein L,D-transpeptidase catalytic domain-containing protein n=1 Tax=Mucilaginibacter sp. OK283 TaxID=1881049 RepID=UPI0008BA7B5A|nr:murein L,D-transpeptidase catalytic domain family protein [Mucilaginibacter sp. OK283]SEO21637.1 L,D-transpeptidase catalytic domain [Mucilaginibacter sp. OK283]